MARKITKRIKACAQGCAGEGAWRDAYHLRRTVLDDNDEPYTHEEIEAALEWLWKKIA